MTPLFPVDKGVISYHTQSSYPIDFILELVDDNCMLRGNSKWHELREKTPEILRDLIRNAKTKGATFAANKFATRVGISADKLLTSLKGWRMSFHWDSSDFDLEMLEIPKKEKPVPAVKKAEKGFVPIQPPGSLALNDDEAKFLESYRKGEIGFEQVQREFAYRVLQKVMQNPELLKVNDWLKSEVIKIQREELSMKKEQMERSWALLFGSFHIEKFCPHCGHDLFPASDINKDLQISGVIDIDDIQPAGLTSDIQKS